MRPVSPRAVVALALSVAAARAVFAQSARGPDGQSGLVTVDSTSFWIDPPRGWVLDAESGKRDGLLSVFYKQGESWRTGEPVMYAAVITRKIGYNAVIPGAIRSDSANWAGQATDFVFTVRDSLRTISGAVAQIRAYQSTSTKHFETVAYVQGEERVWILGLTARSRETHDAAYADFLSLVKSYAPGPDRKQIE